MTTPEEIEGSPPLREEWREATLRSQFDALESFKRLADKFVERVEGSPVAEPRCESCRYFDAETKLVVRSTGVTHEEPFGAAVEGFEATREKLEHGKCRLRGPQVIGWPTVQASDWCGEFKAR